MKGPKYREPRMINWIKTFEYINGIAECQIKWANKENARPEVLNGWAKSLIYLVSKRISKLKKLKRFRYFAKKSILSNVRRYLINLHDNYVLVPTDKAWSNIAIVCKFFYIKALLREIGLLDNPSLTYSLSMQNKESIIAEHNAKMKKVKIDIQDNQLNLPILLWLPKCMT